MILERCDRDMKVLLINGSPHKEGCTYTALSDIAGELEKQGIQTELFHLGNEPIYSCTGCGNCKRNKTGYCILDNDIVNTVIKKAEGTDGLILGSPVHYAAATGMITAFADRFFYAGGSRLQYKPGTAVVSCRRGGSTAALEQLMKYFTINNMPVVSGQYWNMVHGSNPEEVRKDEEGMQNMRVLGRNMAWMLKSFEAGRKNGVPAPEAEKRTYTNFIR